MVKSILPLFAAAICLSLAARADDEPLPKPIQYKGGHDFASKATNRVVKDLPGTITFVKEKEQPDPKAWEGVTMRPHTHYCPEFCLDVNNHVKGWKHGINVMGPQVPFKVANRFTWGQVGGAVYTILEDGMVIGFGHLTQISARVYKAAQTGETLPAGTYLGSFTARIGVNDSPHTHMQAWPDVKQAVGGQMGHLVKRTVWIPRLLGKGQPGAPVAQQDKPAQDKPAQGVAQGGGARKLPATATLAERAGLRREPVMQDSKVFRWLEVGTKVKLLESKPAFGSPNAFCKAEVAGKPGYIRCDKPGLFKFAD